MIEGPTESLVPAPSQMVPNRKCLSVRLRFSVRFPNWDSQSRGPDPILLSPLPGAGRGLPGCVIWSFRNTLVLLVLVPFRRQEPGPRKMVSGRVGFEWGCAQAPALRQAPGAV